MGEGFRVRVTQALLDRLAGRRPAGGGAARPAGGGGGGGAPGEASGAPVAVGDPEVQAALGESAQVGGLLLKREGEELAKAQAQARRLIRSTYECVPSPPPSPHPHPFPAETHLPPGGRRARTDGGLRRCPAGCRSAGPFARRSGRLASNATR